MTKVAAIIPAAGLGKRFGKGNNKALYTLSGKPLLVWVLEAFEGCAEIDEIIPVLKGEDMDTGSALLKQYRISKAQRIVQGGRERQDSVRNGLQALGSDVSVVVIHDGARPLVDGAMVKRTLAALPGCDGAITGVPVKDTIKEAVVSHSGGEAKNAVVQKTLDRSILWSIQTPQTFTLRTLRDAHEKAHAEDYYGTDDAALVERYGGVIRIVMGSYRNIKITTPEDICVAEALLRQ
jgi:2-C-methyl-D-erythritol 4-phosphate cytidylyltransferase